MAAFTSDALARAYRTLHSSRSGDPQAQSVEVTKAVGLIWAFMATVISERTRCTCRGRTQMMPMSTDPAVGSGPLAPDIGCKCYKETNDKAQEAVENVIARMDKTNEIPADPDRYLRRVAEHVVFDERRKMCRDKRGGKHQHVNYSESQPPNADSSDIERQAAIDTFALAQSLERLEKDMLASDIDALLRQGLSSGDLDEKDVQLFRERWLQDATIKQLADKHDLGVATVHGKVKAILNFLRRGLTTT